MKKPKENFIENNDNLDDMDRFIFSIAQESYKTPRSVKERIQKTIDSLFANKE